MHSPQYFQHYFIPPHLLKIQRRNAVAEFAERHANFYTYLKKILHSLNFSPIVKLAESLQPNVIKPRAIIKHGQTSWFIQIHFE